MHYRRLRYRSTTTLRAGSLAGLWQSERLRLLAQARWQPDADVFETATGVEVTVDIAGVDEDDFEVQLAEDTLVVEGHRRPGACPGEAVYHAAGIRYGPFRIELALPAPVDADRVEARYERGLLRITLPRPSSG